MGPFENAKHIEVDTGYGMSNFLIAFGAWLILFVIVLYAVSMVYPIPSANYRYGYGIGAVAFSAILGFATRSYFGRLYDSLF